MAQYHGYMQDLSQLMEEEKSLLPGLDDAEGNTLIDGSRGDSPADGSHLTSINLPARHEADPTAIQLHKADKAEIPAPPIISKQDYSVSTSILDLPSPSFDDLPLIMAPPLMENNAIPGRKAPALPQPAPHDQLPLKSITNMEISPQPLSSTDHRVQTEQQQPSNMATPTSPTSGFLQPTTLASRNTNEVMAELKRTSPHHTPQELTSKRRQVSYVSEGGNSLSTISDLQQVEFRAGSPDYAAPDDASSGEEHGGFESSDEENEQPKAKPRKITERKRKLNAVADQYIQERNQRQIKTGKKVLAEDDAQQSTKWLVNQSENRQIISSPREYQVELFEKAKEKNIIAVLDTGWLFPSKIGSHN